MSTRIEENIKLLEKGISLQQFADMQDQLMIDGSMEVYNDYGMYVVHNKTENVYLIDGGNGPSAFQIGITIPQYFLSYSGYGNPYMHQHYANGDEMILKFYRFNSEQYPNMQEMEVALTQYYDGIAENYFDYVCRMNGEPIVKGQRPMNYNKYYSGEKRKPVVNKTLAAKLLRLEQNHKYLYEFLNGVFDILVKPIPIFIFMLMNNNNIFYYENVIQKVLNGFFSTLATYLTAVMLYLMYQGIVQIIKLFCCTYKRLVIHVRVFDIIIKLGERKLFTKEDMELLEEHKYNIAIRKNKVSDGKKKAYEHKRAKQENELQYRKEQYECDIREAQFYRDQAEAEFKSAREGDGFFTTAAEKRKNAGNDLDSASWYSKRAEYEKQKIEELERKTRKKL